MIQTDGWTYWNGSKDNTPPILPEERAVTLKFRDKTTTCTLVPNSYRWDHKGYIGDIVAYRIEPQAGDNLIDTTFGEIGASNILASSVIRDLPPNAVICTGTPPSLSASASAGECIPSGRFISTISGPSGFAYGNITGAATSAAVTASASLVGIGDINSDARGAGARYNTGKPQLELLPLRLMARYYELLGVEGIEKKRALNALFRLATFQERGPDNTLLLAIMDLGPSILHDTARVFDYGRKKYKEFNWCKGMQWSVPLACAARHAESILKGEELDPESQLPHRGHFGCNLVMLDTYLRTYREGDDRAPAGLLAPTHAQ